MTARTLRRVAATAVGGLCVAAIGQFIAGGGLVFLLCAAVAAWNAWLLLRPRVARHPIDGRMVTDDDYQKILDWLDQPDTERR